MKNERREYPETTPSTSPKNKVSREESQQHGRERKTGNKVNNNTRHQSDLAREKQKGNPKRAKTPTKTTTYKTNENNNPKRVKSQYQRTYPRREVETYHEKWSSKPVVRHQKGAPQQIKRWASAPKTKQQGNQKKVANRHSQMSNPDKPIRVTNQYTEYDTERTGGTRHKPWGNNEVARHQKGTLQQKTLTTHKINVQTTDAQVTTIRFPRYHKGMKEIKINENQTNGKFYHNKRINRKIFLADNKNTKDNTKKKTKKREPKTKKLKIFHCNARGAKGKIVSIETAVKSLNAHIITLSETKGKPPKIEGYSPWFTESDKKSSGGGVAIAVKEELSKFCQPMEDLETQNQDVVWIQVNLHNKEKICIGCYYGKQESEEKQEVEREFSQLRAQIIKAKTVGQVIMTGDINAKLKIDKEGVSQELSRNGELLQTLLEDLELEAISTKSHSGTWTREHRQNEEEKSVIDYIIVEKKHESNVTENVVDKAGVYRLKSKNAQTDHNSMYISYECKLQKEEKTITKWRTGNKAGWKEFNKKIEKMDKNITKDYNKFEKIVMKTLEDTIGKIKIKVGKNKRHLSDKEKKLKIKVKEQRKKFNAAIKNNENKEKELEIYINLQKELRSETEKQLKEKTADIINKINSEGGTKSQAFWKLKRKISGKTGGANYTTKDEQGKPIEDPEKSKEHIGNFYEDLYQAREETEGYEKWTQEIESTIKRIQESKNMKSAPRPITMKELLRVIKKLLRNKANGPDDIPWNEILKEANEETREFLRLVLEHINNSKMIPEQWLKANINRLYKNKGTRGMCSNERGISLASNLGKV